MDGLKIMILVQPVTVSTGGFLNVVQSKLTDAGCVAAANYFRDNFANNAILRNMIESYDTTAQAQWFYETTRNLLTTNGISVVSLDTKYQAAFPKTSENVLNLLLPDIVNAFSPITVATQ